MASSLRSAQLLPLTAQTAGSGPVTRALPAMLMVTPDPAGARRLFQLRGSVPLNPLLDRSKLVRFVSTPQSGSNAPWSWLLARLMLRHLREAANVVLCQLQEQNRGHRRGAQHSVMQQLSCSGFGRIE